MKNKISPLLAGFTAGLFASFILGCSLLQTKPPTTAESALYTITTNWNPTVVSVTNQTTVTNLVPVYITNTVAGAPVIITNTVTVPVPGPATVVTVTNLVPSYQFATAPATSATVQAVGAGINLAAPGIGTIVASALAALLGVWGTLRSRQATQSNAIATSSVQIIEAARNVFASVSPALAASFNNWIVTHQQDAGIANEVAQLVDQVTGNKLGQAAGVGGAQQILAAVTAPLPVASVAVPVASVTPTIAPAATSPAPAA